MTRKPSDPGASAQARLRNVAIARGTDVQVVLEQFALERLLWRLHQSAHGDRFVLKGAMLFAVWTGIPHRATRDLDLLGMGPNEDSHILSVFQDVCATVVAPDGAEFFADTLTVRRIRDDQEYEGRRVTLTAAVGKARLDLQVDIGFGDAIHPAPARLLYPTLLDHESPSLLTYPRETVVAEKLEVIVSLGLLNSRMKDYFDIRHLSETFAFDRSTLTEAIRRTFERRETNVPTDLPRGLSNAFHLPADKQAQWRGFLKRIGIAQDSSLESAVTAVREFVWPALTPSEDPRLTQWPPGGPWSKTG